MADRLFAYSLDQDDKISSVSDAWLEFALENRAPELTREHVVGRSLWNFVAGTETRALFEDLFLRVRRRQELVEIPFRCDSPDCFRFMRLVLRPAPQDSISCEAVLVREQQRPYYSILDRAFPRSNSTLPTCSMCKRIYAFDTKWLELEDAIRQLKLFDSAELPELRYTVCDECMNGTGPDAAPGGEGRVRVG